MPGRSTFSLVVALIVLAGCDQEASRPFSSVSTQVPACTTAAFGTQKKGALLCGNEGCQRDRLPIEFARIQRGVYGNSFSFFGGGAAWVGVDLDRREVVRVDRIGGFIYGLNRDAVRQTSNEYFREGADWVDIVTIRGIGSDEIDAFACSANDLWLSERADLVNVTDVGSYLYLRNGEFLKTFGGNGLLSGDSGAFVARLNRSIPEHPSAEMDRVRASILQSGAFGFDRTVGDRVFFGDGDAGLSDEAKSRLDRWAFYLNKYPKDRLLIEGHADDAGSNDFNKKIAARRVAAAKAYLIDHDLDGARISTMSYGKDRPAVLGANDAARMQNRRVVAVIQ